MSANRLKLNAEKTELLWAGSRFNVARLLRDHDLTLILGASTVKAADVVRVLGVLFTPDLALDKHAVTVSAKCFFRCANCVVYVVHWTVKVQRHWSMRL